MKRITLTVSGNVQKVGYRAKVVDTARELGLTGFVENLEGGRVKIVAEGDAEALELFRNRIDIKNTLISVSEIVPEYSEATGEFMDFEKKVKEGELHERADTAVEYLKKLIDVTVQGNNALIGKQDQMLGKQDQMIGKQDQMLVKQDEMIEKQDQMIGKQDEMIEKQDQMIGKQDEMIEKQDQMIGKQEQMLVKQDEGLTMQNKMLVKQDQMLAKQDETLVAIKHLDENTGQRFDWLADRYGEFGRKMSSFEESMKEMKEDIHQIKEDMHEMRDAFVRLVDHITKET